MKFNTTKFIVSFSQFDTIFTQFVVFEIYLSKLAIFFRFFSILPKLLAKFDKFRLFGLDLGKKFVEFVIFLTTWP